ncbi:MAG: hypothetical protein H8E37_07865 [Planctomycetes bacterium]|nr:hypothetical protein [Planctomycetota bacterium]
MIATTLSDDFASPLTMATTQSGGRWKPARHLKAISDAIRESVNGHGPRIVVIEAPPRFGKSEMVSYWLPQWYLTRYPDRHVILASYEATFARKWGRRDRDSFKALEGVTGLSVDRASAAAAEWSVAQFGGSMKTAGALGPITGSGAHILIVDDPIKNHEQALSPTIRDGLWDWWQTTASTRLEPGGVAIVMATRWHTDDLSGRLLKAADAGGREVRHIHLPALAEEGDILGRKPGESLWSARWSAEYLRGIESSMDAFWWQALYQQSPGRHGSMEWPDHYFDAILVPEHECPDAYQFGVMSLDPSKGKDAKRGDYSALVYAGLSRGKIWIDCSLERRPSEQIVSDGIDMAIHYSGDLHAFGVETNQFQELLVGEFDRQCESRGIVPLPIVEIVNTVNKKLRISRLGPYLARNQIQIVDNPGGRLLVEQMRQFSQKDISGVHDDGPDAVEMAIRLGIEIQGGAVSDDGLGDRLTAM